MSRIKTIFIISCIAILVIVVAGLMIWSSIPNTYSVRFINPDSISYSLYQPEHEHDDEGEEDHVDVITIIENTRTVPLESGDYCLYTQDENFSNDLICFSVKDTAKEVVLSPDYSNDKLSELLSEEIGDIRAVILSSYSEVIEDFTISDDRLFIRGQWYGATLTQKVPDPSDRGDVYRIILHKSDNSWQPVDIPRLAVNKHDLNNVPTKVLDEVNRMPGSH